jgi:hypothetical protein
MESSETKIKRIPLSQAAERTGYTPEYLNSLSREGILLAQKIGRNWFIAEPDLQAFEAWIHSPNYPKPGRKKNSDETSVKILTPDQVGSKIIPTIQPVQTALAESIKIIPVPVPDPIQTLKPAEFKSPIFKERLIRFALIFGFFWSASVGLTYLLAHGQTKIASEKKSSPIFSQGQIFNPQDFSKNYQEKVGEVLAALNIPRNDLSLELNQKYFPDNSNASQLLAQNNLTQSNESKVAGAEKTTTLQQKIIIPPLSPDAWKYIFLIGSAVISAILIFWFFYSIHRVFLQPVGAFGWIGIIIFFLASSLMLNQFISQTVEPEINQTQYNPFQPSTTNKPKQGINVSGEKQTQEALVTASELNAKLFDYVLKDSLKKGQSLTIVPLEFRNQDFEWKNQEINLAKDSIDSREIARHAIEAEDIDTGSITSRTIRNHTIQGEDINPDTDITLNALNVATLIDLGTNTIYDGNFTGDWNFNGGDLTTTGNITTGTLNAGATTLSGNLDMQNNIIQNIGNAGTDFTATGGLNLHGNLDVNGLVNDIAGTLNLSGNALTAGGLLTITPALGLTINTPGQTVTLETQNFDVNATSNVTLDGINFTYTPTGTYSVTPGSTYTIDATGTISLDSDASSTLSGAGVNLTSDGANAITLTYAATGGTFQLTDGTTRLEVADNGNLVLGDDGATTFIDGSLITLSGNTLITGTITETLTDNSADALDIQEGVNNYLNINTTNTAEAMQFGNATTNPSYSFLGTGLTTMNGGINVVGNGTLGTNSANTLTVNSVISSDIIPEGNSRDFGSNSNRWEYGYFTNIDATNISGVIVTGSTASSSWTINSDNITNNTEIASLIFRTGTLAPIDAVLQWNAANDGSKIIGFDNYNLFNFPIGIYSKVNGPNQTFTAGSLFKFSQPLSDAITQSGAFIGTNIDFSSNLTVPNNASGNQTGFLATLKDGGAGATAIGFQTAGTLDYGLDIGGTIGTADIRLSNGEMIDNLANNQINLNLGTSGTLKLTNGANLATDQTTFNLINDTATTLNIGGAATTFNIGPGGATAATLALAGGSGATGCTIAGDTGNLTCSGNITGGGTGTIGYWSRSGTTLTPAIVTDNLTVGSATSTDAMLYVPGATNQNAWFNLGTGNVGIGTTSPLELLSLGLAGTTKGVLSLSGNTSGKIIIQPAAEAGTYTLTLPITAGTSNQFLQTNGAGVTTWATVSGSLGGLTAATATNTIDNLNFAQQWDWSTATTQNPFTMNFNALTTGSALSLLTSNASLASTNGFFRVANTGAATGATPFVRLQPNSTAGSGITLTNAGNVGIGTTAPATKLDIFGTDNALRLSHDASNYAQLSSSNTGEFTVTASSATDSSIILGNNTAQDVGMILDNLTQDYYLGIDNTDSLFKIGSGQIMGTTPYLTINASGNVGIGIADPGAYKLHVEGGMIAQAYTTGDIMFRETDNGPDVWRMFEDAHSLYTQSLVTGQTVLTIKDSGNIGIGTANPTAKLEIVDGNIQITNGSLIANGVNLSDQISGLGLSLTGNAQTISQLEADVNEQLTIIGGKLDDLIAEDAALDTKIADLEARLPSTSIEEMIATLQSQVDEIKAQNVEILSFLSVTDGNYNLMDGTLEAAGVVAGAFTVKVVAGKPQTIGTAYICPTGYKGVDCAVEDAANLDGQSVFCRY